MLRRVSELGARLLDQATDLGFNTGWKNEAPVVRALPPVKGSEITQHRFDAYRSGRRVARTTSCSLVRRRLESA